MPSAAAWVTLVVFVVSMGLVQYPVSAPIPQWLARKIRKDSEWKFHLNLKVAPFIGFLILLITRCIDGEVVRLGIVGGGAYNVLILFISLAYISIALNSTGLIRAASFFVLNFSARGKERASGHRLFFSFYIFFFMASCIVGNDPIILSCTPFLAYFTRVSSLTKSHAFTYSMFIVSNIASAVLVPSNPTNVLISGKFSLNFLAGFTKYTFLPSLVCAIVALPCIHAGAMLVDRNSSQKLIPSQLLPPNASAGSQLHDPVRAIFHTALLLLTLLLLVFLGSFVSSTQASFITGPAAIMAVSFDLTRDWTGRKKRRPVQIIEMDEIDSKSIPLERKEKN